MRLRSKKGYGGVCRRGHFLSEVGRSSQILFLIFYQHVPVQSSCFHAAGMQPSPWRVNCPTCSSATPWTWAPSSLRRRRSRPGEAGGRATLKLLFHFLNTFEILVASEGFCLGFIQTQIFSRILPRLECDEECATLERNRRLAEALQIDATSDPFNTRSTSVYSSSLKEDARSKMLIRFINQFVLRFCSSLKSSPSVSRKDLKFVTEVEEEMRSLVELANKVSLFFYCI